MSPNGQRIYVAFEIVRGEIANIKMDPFHHQARTYDCFLAGFDICVCIFLISLNSAEKPAQNAPETSKDNFGMEPNEHVWGDKEEDGAPCAYA